MPKQNSKFARIDPRIAARMTGTFRFPPTIKTVNKIISTTLPNVVSNITPATFGIFLASSCPPNPTKFAAGIMPIKDVMKIHNRRSVCAKSPRGA